MLLLSACIPQALYFRQSPQVTERRFGLAAPRASRRPRKANASGSEPRPGIAYGRPGVEARGVQAPTEGVASRATAAAIGLSDTDATSPTG